MIDLALRAMAEPHRRQILHLVLGRELSAGDIASRFTLTRPAISQHLAVLAAAGLVDVRREGTRRLYRARPQGLDELKAYLEEFWKERLQVLARVAEVEERRTKSDATSKRRRR